MPKIFAFLWKLLKWVFGIAFGLIVVLLIVVEALDRYIATDKGGLWLYRNVPIEKRIKRTDSGIRYLEIGDSDKQALLLIHGAPGSIFDWLSLAKQEGIYEKYRLLIVDRPGYCGTRPKGPDRSIENQAKRIGEVLMSEDSSAVVMGHSYGGPIAVVMGALFPDKIEKVFGVSGQYDPNNEKIFKISYAINFQLFRWILPRMIWVSNVEKLTHPQAQKNVLKLYKQVTVPTTLIHGDADGLVPYENSTFLLDFLGDWGKLITMPGYDHPLQMQAVPELYEFIMEKPIGE